MIMNKKNNNPEMQRKVIHNRKIDINCYARDDNLFDIEAKIVDVKPFKTISNYDFDREAYSPIHDMTLTVTINKEFMIKNVVELWPIKDWRQSFLNDRNK